MVICLVAEMHCLLKTPQIGQHTLYEHMYAGPLNSNLKFLLKHCRSKTLITLMTYKGSRIVLPWQHKTPSIFTYSQQRPWLFALDKIKWVPSKDNVMGT